jgi:hypothetical protein
MFARGSGFVHVSVRAGTSSPSHERFDTLPSAGRSSAGAARITLVSRASAAGTNMLRRAEEGWSVTSTAQCT